MANLMLERTGDKIVGIHARQILDCKCRPMVEVDVVTSSGAMGTGAAPTGSSVGMYESFVLRDHDPKEYDGLSVHKAVNHVNSIIAPALIGKSVLNQKKIDQCMIQLDGTEDKHVLGGNAIYSVSVAVLRAAAAYEQVSVYEKISGGAIATVPIPSFNIMNGGRNQGITQSINEFLLVPYLARDIEQAVEIGVKVFQKLGHVIHEYTGRPAQVGGSYGWVSPSEDPKVCLDLIRTAIGRCGYENECALALDCAASEMYDPKTKTYYMDGHHLSSNELVAYYKELTGFYPFVFIEDMLDENDWDGFALAHQEIHKTLLISDDFTVTNPARIKRATEGQMIDGFILKPNQIGTITEALEAHNYAKSHGVLSITSGRSGGVVGDIVMDLAVGLQVPLIKNGCPRSGERIDKLNFLLRVKDRHPGCHMAKLGEHIKFQKG